MSKLEQLLHSFIDQGLPWCTCTLSIDGKVRFDRALGWIDQERTIPASAKTTHRLYSATKIITCICALQLVEEGKLVLDAPVSDYLPEFAAMTVRHPDGVRPAEKTITIRHLFTMTGGLDYNKDPYFTYCLSHPEAGTREIIGICPTVPLNFEPGSHFLYSLCHDVLGAVIEVITGKTLGQVMKERVFDPVGMTHTGFRPVTDEDHPLAPLACRQGKDVWFNAEDPLYFGSENYESGGAGLYSCSEDYMRLLEALCAGRVFSPFILEKLQENQLDEVGLADLRESWDMAGYGWSLGVRTMREPEQANPEVSVGEFGWSGAAGVYYLVDPAKQMALFFNMQVLANMDNPHMQVALRNAAYEFLKELQ